MSYALGLGAGPPRAGGDHRDERVHPRRRRAGAPTSTGRGLPVWITHGRRDPVIARRVRARRARRAERGAVDVTYREHDGAHHVDPRALAELPAWVENAIDAAAAPAS